MATPTRPAVPAPPGSVGFRVTGTRETTEMGPSGRFTLGQRVMYVTTTGAEGSVFVPYSAFTAARVAQLVRTHALQAKQIANLVG